jgi:hypothetical protein
MNSQFVLRTVLSGLVTLLVLISTSLLGIWQYSESQREDIQDKVLSLKPSELSELHQPEEFLQENVFARSVMLDGILECQNSLVLNSGTIDGTLCLFKNLDTLPIVVYLEDTLTLDVVNREIQVIGRIQPSQSYEPVSQGTLNGSEITEVNIHLLVEHYKQSLYDGFVIVQLVLSGSESQEFEIQESGLILPPAGIEFRNLFYAWQWWIFAGFTLLLWLKYVRDEWQKQHETL